MNPIGVPIPFPDDAMPPEGQYSSREELVTAINAWAAPRGYAFSVKSSVVTPSGRTRVIYSCDRGAGKAPKVKPANERKRKTTTRRTGCQFSIAAKESLYDVQGQEKWDTFYKHWHGIVASTTEDIYMERLEKFKQQYSPDHLNEVGYIIETWLELYKERVSPPAPTPLAAAPALRADDPRAIYQRYKEAREAWYATVPRGGLRTNQQYRKAMGLPARYSKIEPQWCLNYKQMGPRCREKSGTREWTKEEQFSYLDWDKAENERVEQNVGEEMAEKPFPQRRGMQHIWDAAERDVLQQGGGA
ncbi:hypothetical protein HZS61_006530 [Fusarium oxysporum f. sp. conglutinans]|uniref:Uncharacterized protein n=1 Tax=Fusarium oxysporum f. sp. conglutinans TaxID=100902 RepID=A0A8H6G9P8_FUSOX|nr:hypothetical protein HZS61_006530 [Fusarium oxysporum f. sp. conglutinans]